MENSVSSTVNQLSVAPGDSDPGSNVYVVTYLTRKHGDGGREVFFEYGPQMDVPAQDLKDGSFNGIGDNLKWAEVLWKFALEGKPYLVRIPMNSPRRGMANGGSYVTPPTPSVTKLPDGSVLSAEDLKAFRSYPFQEMGSLRDAKELGRDGSIVFVDVSDSNGQDKLTEEIITHLRATDNVKNMFGSIGPEFVDQKSLMYAGPGSNALVWPNGNVDQATSRRIADILRAGEKEVPEGASKFKPVDKARKEEKEGEQRFSKDDSMDANNGIDKAQESADKLKNTLNQVKDTAKSIGLVKSAHLVNRVVLSFTEKKAGFSRK